VGGVRVEIGVSAPPSLPQTGFLAILPSKYLELEVVTAKYIKFEN